MITRIAEDRERKWIRRGIVRGSNGHTDFRDRGSNVTIMDRLLHPVTSCEDKKLIIAELTVLMKTNDDIGQTKMAARKEIRVRSEKNAHPQMVMMLECMFPIG